MEHLKDVEESSGAVKVKPTIDVREIIEILKWELKKMGVNDEKA